jgi:ATP/maltotriose-dependent transcriptional regulator MalT
LSNKEIADSIFISLGTLKWHLHNIYGKLGVNNRYGARVRAHDLKLLKDKA